MKKIYLLLCLSLVINTFSHAQTDYWSDIDETAIATENVRHIIPNKYRTVRLDVEAMQSLLVTAPQEFNPQNQTIQVSLPMPNGKYELFAVTESPIMEAGLAAQFPNIKTYIGQGITNPRATLRFDWTYKGFHAMVISDKGRFFIDPYSEGNTQDYISYDKKDFDNPHQFSCLTQAVDEEIETHEGTLLTHQKAESVGEQLRTYRLACAATGEYTQFHGGTVNSAMSAITTAMNRVNGIYETEVAVRMILINNNNLLIYTNGSTDPYTNNNGGQMLGQNQANINSVIGSANYDIGHVFSTGGGGIAALRSPCGNNSKARGVTGLGSPIGDPFYVDYVAHEMGHQFGGNHTFNGNSGSCAGNNRNGSTAYEPGSGTTIMGYAGICPGQNLQLNSDAFFHTISFDEIIAFTQNGNGNNCAVITNTGNNQPNVDAGTGGYVIPKSTPFELIGSAIDPDGDPLTYSWEQFDLGPAGAPDAPLGSAPLFRSFPPKNIPSRTFPRIETILSSLQILGEVLPSYDRVLNFRLTARDNVAGGGGVSYDGMSMNVTSSAGPFLVLEPNTSATVWNENAPALVQWDVANTDQSPVNCALVDIVLSTDGGFTYPHTLATGVPNNGTTTIFVPPGTATNTARVRVQCSTNVFFDISNQNFTINVATVPDYFLWDVDVASTICAPDDATFQVWVAPILNFSDPVTLSIDSLPDGVTANFSANPATPGDTILVTLTNTENAPTGGYDLIFNASSTSSDKTTELDFTVFAQKPTVPTLLTPADGEALASVSTRLTWQLETAPHTYDIQIADDVDFSNIIEQATDITNNIYTVTNTLMPYSIYYWRVRANNQCVQGEYSEAFVFRTAAVACTTSTGSTQRSILPFLAVNYSSFLDVTQDVEIVDLNVKNVRGQHTRINDLSFRLESPIGKVVSLMPRICNNENDFDINFDDQANNANYPCPPTDGGTYQPEGSLADFNGDNSLGEWRLIVQDHEIGNGGSVDNWELEICSASTVDNEDPIVVTNNTLNAIQLETSPVLDSVLLATDVDNTPGELIYTLVTAPQFGSIQLNGSALTIGQTFRQSDIDAENMTYVNTDANATTDQFRFHVTDIDGGFTGTPTFNINIQTSQAPPVDITINTALLYPNPTSNLLNVGMNVDSDQSIQVFVINALGQLVGEEVFEVTEGFNQLELDTGKLADGVYFIRIEGNSIEVTEKFMVVR